MQYISCLSNQIKDGIKTEFRESGISDKKIEEFMEKLPSCGKGIPVEIREIEPQKSGKTKNKSKTKRKPSVYNQFISKCMKEANIKKFGEASLAMKQCAIEWRKNKDEILQGGDK